MSAHFVAVMTKMQSSNIIQETNMLCLDVRGSIKERLLVVLLYAATALHGALGVSKKRHSALPDSNSVTI